MVYLESINQCQVVEGDVVVVVLDVAEGLLVILHQRVDLAVFPLLDLVDFCLPAQVKLITQHPHLLLILGLNLCRGSTNQAGLSVPPGQSLSRSLSLADGSRGNGADITRPEDPPRAADHIPPHKAPDCLYGFTVRKSSVDRCG